MATREQLIEALRNADAAGEEADARQLAAALAKMNTPAGPQNKSEAEILAEFNEQPWYGQAGTAADDLMRLLSNGITLGYRDKLAEWVGGGTPEEERAKTAEAEIRSGFPGKVAEATGMVENPIGLIGRGTQAATQGMGALRKLLTNLGVAGSEGALISGVDAMGHDDPEVTDAMIKGGMIGPAARIGARTLGSGVDKIANVFNKQSPRLTSKDVPIPIHTSRGGTMIQTPTGMNLPISNQKAMDLYSRKERAIEFEDMLSEATRKSKRSKFGDLNQSIRDKLDTGILSKKKVRANYPEKEIAAIDEVVSGTPGRNFSARMGALAPTSNPFYAGMGGGVGGMIGYAAGSPALGLTLAAGLPAAGWVSKIASNRMTKRAAGDVLDTIVSGSKRPPKVNVVQDMAKTAVDPLEKLLRALAIADQRADTRR